MAKMQQDSMPGGAGGYNNGPSPFDIYDEEEQDQEVPDNAG
jgi:hypothetical protein